MKRSHRQMKARLAFTGILFSLLFLALGLRAFQLHMLEGEKLKRLGERQHLEEWTLLPKRGTILDRAGEPLALSLEGQSVYARPRRLKEEDGVARKLAQALNLDPLLVRQKLKAERPFVWIKRQITPKEAERVKAVHREGIGISYEPNRYYPQGRVAGQLLGFVGRDSQGLEGIELHYDGYVRGATGSSVVERDALGRRLLAGGVEGIQLPSGADVHLTLDTTIQHLAEKQLEAAVTRFRAKAGVAVAVEPFTGEVLALANYPFFDPNDFTHQSAQQWRNRAVADSYEPGSTFKAILAAAALEEGVVGRDDLFYCELGSYSYAGKIIHDTHRHGWLPFYRIIQYSSNIGAAKVAERLRKERYFPYIERFGFGQPTGIDLPGEAAGLVRPPSQWSLIDLAAHSFGQGIAVTPMQLVMAYAAIANGGHLLRPFVVRRVVSQRGEVLLARQPHIVRRVITEKSARLLTSILQGVVSDGGTGVLARIEGFKVAGKTGTAQKPDLTNGGYDADKRSASFVGFVPADDPRLVLLVLIDEPKVDVHGGAVAAPAFQNIARGALLHLGVAPEKSAALLLARGQVTPVRFGGKGGSEAADLGGLFGVPDFTGLSLRAAIAKARSLGLRVEIRGNGYVVQQSPAPGVGWGRGKTLVLILRG